MHTSRLKEVERERDAALEDVKQAKAECEDITSQLYQVAVVVRGCVRVRACRCGLKPAPLPPPP